MSNNIMYPDFEPAELTAEDIDTLNEETVREDAENSDRDDGNEDIEENY